MDGKNASARDNWTPAAGLVLWSNEWPNDTRVGRSWARTYCHSYLRPLLAAGSSRMWAFPAVRMFALPLMRDHIRCPVGLLPPVIGLLAAGCQDPDHPCCTFKINSILTMVSRLAAEWWQQLRLARSGSALFDSAHRWTTQQHSKQVKIKYGWTGCDWPGIMPLWWLYNSVQISEDSPGRSIPQLWLAKELCSLPVLASRLGCFHLVGKLLFCWPISFWTSDSVCGWPKWNKVEKHWISSFHCNK